MALIFDSVIEYTLESLVKSHCIRQKSDGIPITYGFLIGSKLGKNDSQQLRIIHLAPCPVPDSVHQDEKDPVTSGEDRLQKLPATECIDSDWICHLAEQTDRLLPGGFEILGLYALAAQNTLTSLTPPLKRTLLALRKLIARISWWQNINSELSNSDMCLLFVETPLGRSRASILKINPDSTAGNLIPQEQVVFKNIPLVPLKFRFDLDLNMPLTDSQVAKTDDFKTKLLVALKPSLDGIISSDSVLLFDGSLKTNTEDLLEKENDFIGKKQKNKAKADLSDRETPVKVELFVGSVHPTADQDSASPPVVQEDSGPQGLYACAELVKIRAAISCLGCLPVDGSKVWDGGRAVIQDILRNLYGRLELHTDSMGMIEDELSDPFSLHQLPRRVAAAHPVHSALMFSDYLLEADTKQEAIDNFREFLNVDIDEDSIHELEHPLTMDQLKRLGIALPLIDTSVEGSSLKRISTQHQISESQADSWRFDKIVVTTVISVWVAMMAIMIWYFWIPQS